MGAPYATVDDVVAYLGGPAITTAQAILAEQTINAATAYANRVTLQAWNLDPITSERYYLRTSRLLLQSPPVASIQQIQIRTTIIGDPLAPLVAGTDYELLDPQLGLVIFAPDYSFDGYGLSSADTSGWTFGRPSPGRAPSEVVFVDYTPNRPVPADIADAVVMIAAESLYAPLNADRRGITQAQADRDTVVRYADFQAQLVVPPKAEAILRGYRPVLWG